MDTCVVRIRGGLGNQMFQYAFAYLLSNGTKDKSIVLDIREFEKYYWPFGLCDFTLTNNSFVSKDKQKYDRKIKRFHIKQFLFKKMHKPLDYYNERLLKKGFLLSGRYCKLPDQIPSGNIYLYGYFQDANILSPFKSELNSIFSLKKKNELIDGYIKEIKDNSLSISIRFAEQVELDNGEKFVYSQKDYYVNLIKLIEKKRGYKPQIVVSSNNIERIVEEHWFDCFNDVVFIKNCSATEQIEILKRCRDFIISNSTFSWWAAFLGSDNKDSIILTPRIWYQGDRIENTKLFFEGMEIIE